MIRLEWGKAGAQRRRRMEASFRLQCIYSRMLSSCMLDGRRSIIFPWGRRREESIWIDLDRDTNLIEREKHLFCTREDEERNLLPLLIRPIAPWDVSLSSMDTNRKYRAFSVSVEKILLSFDIIIVSMHNKCSCVIHTVSLYYTGCNVCYWNDEEDVYLENRFAKVDNSCQRNIFFVSNI